MNLHTAYYAQMGVGLTHSIIGLGMFLSRRDKFPIRARHKPLVSSAVVTYSLMAYASPHLSEPPVFCSWINAISLSFSLILMNIILVRLFRFWFLFSVAREQMSLHNAPDWNLGVVAKTNDFGKAHRKLTFTDRRKYISNRWLFGGFVSLTLFQMTVHFSNFAAFRRSTEVDIYDPKCFSTLIRVVLYAFFGLMFVCLAVVAYLIRNQRDNYHIRKELVLFLVFVVIAYVVTVPTDRGLLQTVLSWFPIQFSLSTMTWYPIYLSYRAERTRDKLREEDAQKRNDAPAAEGATEESRRPSIGSARLIQVLLNDEYIDARRSFQRFLVREFAVENLLFFKATREFETTSGMSDAQVGAAALQLYMEFLANGAPYQVNIDSTIRIQIDTDLKTCFDGFEKVKYAYGGNVIPGVSVDTKSATILSLEVESARRESTHVLKDHEISSVPATPRSIASQKGTISNGEREIDMPAIKSRVCQNVYKAAREAIISLLEIDGYIRWRNEYTSGEL